MSQELTKYFSKIGKKGGKASRRTLDPVTAKNMVLVREAQRAYKKFHAQCFWSFDPKYKITTKDIKWIADQLKKNGNLKLWKIGVKLCP